MSQALVSLILLIGAGYYIHHKMGKFTAFVVAGVPAFVVFIDALLEGDQTLFRQVVFNVYALLLVLVSVYARRR